jgi:hypothetical protein
MSNDTAIKRAQIAKAAVGHIALCRLTDRWISRLNVSVTALAEATGTPDTWRM